MYDNLERRQWRGKWLIYLKKINKLKNKKDVTLERIDKKLQKVRNKKGKTTELVTEVQKTIGTIRIVCQQIS